MKELPVRKDGVTIRDKEQIGARSRTSSRRRTLTRERAKVTTGPQAPDWYPDPSGKPGLKYWDGRQWHTDIPGAAVADSGGESAPPVMPAAQSRTKIWAGISVVAVLTAAAVVVTVMMINHNHRATSSASGPAQAASSAQPSHSPAQSPTAPSTSVASANVAGLAPFARQWLGMRESIGIDANGHGNFHYMMACASCSMADMPYNTLEFTLISVSEGTASGSVTASSDPDHPVGEPVAATLAPQDTIRWVVGGKYIGLFCGSNPAWCGG